MNFRVEPGSFKVMLGASSTDIRLHGQFEITPKPPTILTQHGMAGILALREISAEPKFKLTQNKSNINKKEKQDIHETNS